MNKPMPQQDLHSELSAALQSADPRVLAALVTHLSGDCALVRPDIEADALRAIAAEVLAPFCTREKQASPPSDEVLQTAMDLCAGQTVPPEYGPMMRDQTGLGPPLPAAMDIAPPRQAHDAYNEAVEAELAHYVWTHPAMDSWYKNSRGKVTTNLPWRLVDYWMRSREPNMSHFQGQ